MFLKWIWSGLQWCRYSALMRNGEMLEGWNLRCSPALLYPLLLHPLHDDANPSFLHSFMDGCLSLWLLLLIDVCWHHKIWGITSLLWHSMMHYWLLQFFIYFFSVWGSFGFPFFFFLFTSLHFRYFRTLRHTFYDWVF